MAMSIEKFQEQGGRLKTDDLDFERFRTEPEVELTLASWPVAAGVDPLQVQERVLGHVEALRSGPHRALDQRLQDDGVGRALRDQADHEAHPLAAKACGI